MSLGGSLHALRPTEEAAELAGTAAAVVGEDLIGVDLLPIDGGAGYVVFELNGAVGFDERYSLRRAGRRSRYRVALQLQTRRVTAPLVVLEPMQV